MKKTQLYFIIILAVIVIGAFLWVASSYGPIDNGSTSGDHSSPTSGSADIANVPASSISTFEDTGDEICRENGKPVVRLFSTSTCPHCIWIMNRFNAVIKQYVDEGKIVAYHWELDKMDDTLTPEKEDTIPDSERQIFYKYGPQGYVPLFGFGCKYTRLGNGYEAQNDLNAEEAEFRAVIEALIK